MLSRRFSSLVTVLAVVAVVGVAVVEVPMAVAQTDEPPALPREVIELARQIEQLPPMDQEEVEVMPEDEPPDPSEPVNAIPTALGALESLLATAEGPVRRPLEKALRHAEEAWFVWTEGEAPSHRQGSGDGADPDFPRQRRHSTPSLDYLLRTAAALRHAQARLAQASSLAGGPLNERLEPIRRTLADVGDRVAADILHGAELAGVPEQRLDEPRRLLALGRRSLQSGHYQTAQVQFAGALGLTAKTVKFDLARFRQNLLTELTPSTVGYAFSIAYMGQLYEGGSWGGLARTGADSPVRFQAPDKEMHVASVSKWLTAIVVLRALQDRGIKPDTPVAPYLPSDWAIGSGVESLTFRDFMRHQSGFAQKEVANEYADLRAGIAQAAGDTSYAYKNANFGLMRVLVPGIYGYDVTAYHGYDPAALSAAIFVIVAQQLFGSIGVHPDCRPTDTAPTLMYDFPGDHTTPGHPVSNLVLKCGGYGWFVSSNEIASVGAHLRLTQKLLSNEYRTIMQQQFLGYRNPAFVGGSSGAYGQYYMHGGFWFTGGHKHEAHTCTVAFPIHVQVGLVINSKLGPSLHRPCTVLREAFDAAWVPS